MKYTVTMDVTVSFTDAEPLVATTTGLREIKMAPIEARFALAPSPGRYGSLVRLRGPKVLRNGTHGAWIACKVSLDSGPHHYEQAPQWLVDVVNDVRTQVGRDA